MGKDPCRYSRPLTRNNSPAAQAQNTASDAREIDTPIILVTGYRENIPAKKPRRPVSATLCLSPMSKESLATHIRDAIGAERLSVP